MGDHPAIANALRTGYPHGDPTYPHCPVCGCETDEIYTDTEGVVFACSECVQKKSAWECDECFQGGENGC